MVTVIDPLEELLRVARQEFPLRNHSSVFKVKALMDRLHARDFHLEQRMERLAREVSWSCDSIFHDSPFHLNLFRIPKGNGIPFHDHPQMTVFFKVLWGTLSLEAYDWAEEYPFEGLARCSIQETLNGASETLLISPKKGNLHQIVALEDCAFVDLLLPPYCEESGRACHYYKKLEPYFRNGEWLTPFVLA